MLSVGRTSRPDHTFRWKLTSPPSTPPHLTLPLCNGLWRAAAASPGALIRYLLLSFTWALRGGRAGPWGGARERGEEWESGGGGGWLLEDQKPSRGSERRGLERAVGVGSGEDRPQT